MRRFSFPSHPILKSAPSTHMVSLFIAASALLSSCNDDIFIKETFFDERELKIEGDGGFCSVKYQPKNLTRVGIEVNNIDEFTIATYDRNGDRIDNGSPVTEIGGIVYISPDITLSLMFEGKRLLISSVEHSVLEYTEIPVVFEYGSLKEYVYVTLAPGRQKEFVSSSLDLSQATVKDEGTYSISEVFKNNGPAKCTFEVKPYEHASGYINLATDDNWAKNLDYFGEVPYYNDGKVTAVDMTHGTFSIIGEYCGHPMDESRRNTVLIFDVPPYSKAEVRVRYVSGILPFSATYRNPISERTMITTGQCEFQQPYTYEVIIEDLPSDK